MKLMDQWLEEERLGTLNTAPPPLPLAPVTEGNVVVVEAGPSEVPDQQPSIDAEEQEVMASNSLATVEEPVNKVTSGFMSNHDLINLDEEEEPATVADNDLLA